jgi:chromosome segregation ATPase
MSALEQKIDEIEQKRRDHERNEELEQAVDQADERLVRHNERMASLEDSLEEFVHRNTVLTDMFGRAEAQGVETVRTRLRDVTGTTSDDILAAVSEGDLSDEAKTVSGVERVVESVVDDTRSRLSDVEKKWVSKVSTAESIIRITDGSNEAIRLTQDLEEFVRREAWKLSKDTGRLATEWSGLEAKWDEIGVDWETFQQKHGLSDETIRLLKKIADDQNVTLSSTNADAVMELHRVKSLRENLELTI